MLESSSSEGEEEIQPKEQDIETPLVSETIPSEK
jgi:hypothetical protein